MLVPRSFLVRRQGTALSACDDPSARLKALARPLTAAQLRLRRWVTFAGTAAVFLLLPALAWQASLVVFLLASCVVLGLVLRWWLARLDGLHLIPPVWETATDQEIVQLAEMAHLYPEVARLLRAVGELGRQFTYQDWLQARAIELELGRAAVSRQAGQALQQLQALPSGAAGLVAAARA